MFTKEDYVDWRTSKVTRTLIDLLVKNRKARLEEIAEGKVEGNQLYIAIGQCQGIKDTISFLYNEYNELQDLFILEETTNGRNETSV